MSEMIERIAALKKEKNAVILAHTYQPGEVQDIADYVGDSYGLSVEATRVEAEVIVFCGVRFMAETAAILNPSKTVILPEPKAGCPMADMITPEELAGMKEEHPDYLVVCYVNSTAEIKAMSDICCTSSNALKIVRQIPEDKGILFIPDKHLGSYVKEQTGRNIELWDGFCPTHVKIEPDMVREAKEKHPNAPVLMHPEAPKASRELADALLSTGGMCTYVVEDDASEYIIATEIGIIHTLKKKAPNKTFYPLTERALCPNMKRGSVDSTLRALEGTGGERVTVAPETAKKAIASLERMLEMSKG